MPLLWVRQQWAEDLSVEDSPNAKREFEIVTDEIEYSQIQATQDLWSYLVSESLHVYGNMPVSRLEVKRLRASGCFLGEVGYGPRQVPTDGAWDFTVENRPETRKLLMGRTVAASYAIPGVTPPDLHKFVGVQDDATVEGREVGYAVSHYSAQVYWDQTRFVSTQPDANHKSLQAYVDMLKSLTNKVNSSNFQFFAVGALEKFLPGECRLLSTKRSFAGPSLIRFDLELEGTPLYYDPALAPMNGGIPVLVSGFDHVEVAKQKELDPASGQVVPKPTSGIVTTMHERANLNLLLVPTPPPPP